MPSDGLEFAEVLSEAGCPVCGGATANPTDVKVKLNTLDIKMKCIAEGCKYRIRIKDVDGETVVMRSFK